ncbi:putative inner membrane protein [Novipirellula aureliae]|uniref:Putative inner membrane protein n=1 Tax=Novipirellula aureliae TaxID=2527966 RepID=A0A5C6DBK2_9BACT|nr:AI-2E family transporter [Novipirellula aureliae]TWU34563.1 putative inner membrane protein [Novipirellula aureliae]
MTKRRARKRPVDPKPASEPKPDLNPPADPPADPPTDPPADSEQKAKVPDAAPIANAARPPDIPSSVTDRLNRLPSLSRILSVVMLLLGIVAVGALFYRVMAGFFVPLFLSALLVVIFHPVYDWIYTRIGNRRRTAAVATTFLILTLVLMPIIVVLSVATSQFTSMVSQMNFRDIETALDRAREQVGISLPHAEKFRRLDQLTDAISASSLNDEQRAKLDSDTPLSEFIQVLSSFEQRSDNRELVEAELNEAENLIVFLQQEVDGPVTANAAATVAIDRLEELRRSLAPTKHGPLDLLLPEPSEGVEEQEEVVDQLTADEQFHQKSVIASAAIRSWMKILLGGSFRSQVKLVANPSAEDFKKLLVRARETLQPRFVSLTSATGSYFLQILIGMVVLVISVYFFLVDGAAMIRTLMRLSPLDDNYERRLLLEFDRTSRAVVLASALSALIQGILAGIGFWTLGFESVVLLFLATTLMALVPFLGAASVWVPATLWLGLVEQQWMEAGALAIYGVVIISSIDNVIKVYVLQGRSQLHPLFALLSVLGGVKVFGPIGILVGPMVVVFLQTLLEILNHELEQREEVGTSPASHGLETDR